MKGSDGREMILVFGSNEAGIHGAGAALYALHHNAAKMGLGFGPYGNGFALPTKDWNIRSLPLEAIQFYVFRTFAYADSKSAQEFQITQIGCGLAGNTAEEIAPMWVGAPSNCLFDEAWRPFLGDRRFWGTK